MRSCLLLVSDIPTQRMYHHYVQAFFSFMLHYKCDNHYTNEWAGLMSLLQFYHALGIIWTFLFLLLLLQLTDF